MLKKIAAAFIAVFMTAALAGCGSSKDSADSGSDPPAAPARPAPSASAPEPSAPEPVAAAPSVPDGELRQIEIDSVVYTLPLTGADLIAMGLSVAPDEDTLQVDQQTEREVVWVNSGGSRIITKMRNMADIDPAVGFTPCPIEDARVMRISGRIDCVKTASLCGLVSTGDDVEAAKSKLRAAYPEHILTTYDSPALSNLTSFASPDESCKYMSYLCTQTVGGYADNIITELYVYDRNMPGFAR